MQPEAESFGDRRAKPGVARVTRMPLRLAAATSILRMSTARAGTRPRGRALEEFGGPGVWRSETTISQP